MALEAHVQGRFVFAGLPRKPGDVITADELRKTTPQQRDALISQNLIVLALEGAPINGDDREKHLAARVDLLTDEIAALKAALNAPSEALIAAIRDVAKSSVADAVAEAAQTKPRGRRGSSEAI